MKKVIDFIVLAFMLAMPFIGECKTVAYSPSIPGQPLIFNFNTAYNAIQPSQFSAVTWTQMENALLIRSSYSHHLENLSHRCCCAEWDFWAAGMGQWQHQNSKQEQIGYNDVTGGLTLGADTCFNDFVVGGAVSYTHSNIRWKKSAGDSQIDSYYGGLYGNWNNGNYYVNAALLGAFSEYHTSRHLPFGVVERHAHAGHNSGEVLTRVEGGVILQEQFYGIDLVPFIGVDYIYLAQQGYSERGADRYNLSVGRRHDQLLQSESGLKFTRRILCEFCHKSWLIVPFFSIHYINQTSLTGLTYHTHFVNRNQEFSVKGWDFNRNLGAIGFNLSFLDCSETINFTLYYEGQFGKNYWNQFSSIVCNLCF